MRLWIAPLIRFRRAVLNYGPHLSVAYDLICFIKFFGFEKKNEKYMNVAVDSTIGQISPSGAE